MKNKASKGYEVMLLHCSPIRTCCDDCCTWQETYFFVVRPGQGVFYNEIETRYGIMYQNDPNVACLISISVRLTKRRGKTTRSAMNSKLIVKHREMTDDELLAQVRFSYNKKKSNFILSC